MSISDWCMVYFCMKETNITSSMFTLKTNKQTLLELLINSQNEVTKFQEKITEIEAENTVLREQLDHLQNQFDLMKRQLFGQKSEKKGSDQTVVTGLEELFDEAVEAPEVILEILQEETAEEPITATPTKKRGRRPLPKNLPREQVIHDLPEEEKVCSCGHPLCKIGEEKSEQLEIIPATVKVIEHVRFKYSCRVCEEGVKTAPLPAQPIPKSMATPGLLSHVFISKFDDHLPLYRQSEIWERLGVDLCRSTLSNWVIKGGDLLAPLVKTMQQEMLKGSYIRADETTVQVMKSDRKATQKSYMWLYMTGGSENHNLVYEYQPTRHGEHAAKFLKGFQGYLQTDAYKGYNEVTSQEGIVSVGCWAHGRRNFVDVVNLGGKHGKAAEALTIIQKLYAIEHQAKEQKLMPDKLKEWRQEKAKPILEKFKIWLEELKPKVPPKSPLYKAISYTLNHWAQLTCYLEDGRLDIDNNAGERAIRPFVIGRKNWLFMGNVKGAQAAATIYSVIETAKANGLNPSHYLRYILTKLPITPAGELSTLLPWACKEAVNLLGK